ncbi:MAG TPA: hypothetical protein VEZ41_00980, partial [Allosphingosinicella sp.]|nr:hypothetical protein [Allosphingosinicella sp.]
SRPVWSMRLAQRRQKSRGAHSRRSHSLLRQRGQRGVSTRRPANTAALAATKLATRINDMMDEILEDSFPRF